MGRDREVSPEITAAEGVAISALAYLADDAGRLGRFLTVTGINPAQIRQLAGDQAFLAAVLDHIGADERLLVAFADASAIAPSAVTRAKAALSGRQWEREVP
jgi:hypothetical protein